MDQEIAHLGEKRVSVTQSFEGDNGFDAEATTAACAA